MEDIFSQFGDVFGALIKVVIYKWESF
jgi:hypothetical protein